MNFYQLAIKNVTRNLRAYLAFYLSSSFAVMIFYLFAMFIFHPALEEGYMNNIAQKGMAAAEWIIFVFSILFVLYSVSAFLHTRKREFGVLTITGTSPRQLRVLLTVENMLIGLSSIVSGIAGGTILAKLFFAAGGYVLDMEPLSLYFPGKAMGLTAAVFLLLFFIISQFILFFIKSEKTVALLKGAKTPKGEPKPSILLSIIALGFLSTGYGMALTAEINLPNAVIILITTVIGTFFFFSQLSIWIVKLLKKNKRFYLKGFHLLSISDLTYRLKDNARLFFIVSIVSAVAFTATGVLTVYQTNLHAERTQYEIEYLSSPDNEEEAAHIDSIEKSLKENGFAFTTDEIETIEARYEKEDGSAPPVLIFSQEQFSTLQPSVQEESIEAGQAIFYKDNRGVLSKEDIPANLDFMDTSSSIEVKKVESSVLSISSTMVVNEETFQKLRTSLEPSTLYGYNYQNWKDSVAITQQLKRQLFGDYSNINFDFSAKAVTYFITVQLPSLSLFIGLFVAIVFFLAAGSFLYFRLFTDLEAEREKYKALSKIGLTEREMKRSATWQLGILFFMPFLVATVHTGFALMVLEREGFFNVFAPSVMTILGFLVLQIVYFIVVRFSYIKKLTASITD
ncbi:ABC transporter permease [Halobacillus shinanisalinarum]|uniref:ABC transporter permease n=1 Tax=Halobacillus shinanisalinarum TaxID=2932258 RepID=A0ABY4GXS8_9BACI|nr:ABC transporter permease [Halobacillus shinanisalinarum]UOQ92903.1 ABC transporter permease [Halobacillus shinanisalinarum]